MRQTGSGMTQLTGDSSHFAGTTYVESGVLSVNGKLGGTVDVGSGARLQGNGDIGNVIVRGTMAPGNSIGTINVGGDLSFESGSVYQVEANAAGEADLIRVAGTAMINGGAVEVLAADGEYSPQTSYTILTADGGVTGTFNPDVNTDLAFLDGALSYDASNVYLTLTRNNLTFDGIGTTPNQIAVGAGTESLKYGNAVFNAVLGLNADQARDAFDQLAGEIHASARAGLLEDTQYLRSAVWDRLRSAEGKHGGWVRAYGAWAELDGDGNAAGLDSSGVGTVIGSDAALGEHARAGLTLGYAKTDYDVDARRSSASVDTLQIGAYAGGEWGPVQLRTGIAYAWSSVETSRSIVLPNFEDSAQADYDSNSLQVFGELAYRLDLGQSHIEPFANIAYVHVTGDAFVEKGGEAALAVDMDASNVTFTTLGMRGDAHFNLGKTTASLRGGIGWRHGFGDIKAMTSMTYVSGGDSFATSGIGVAGDAVTLEAGLDVALGKSAGLGLFYGGQLGGSQTRHSVGARLSLEF
ncbi:MAG: hypothetical protein BGO57_14735 [Sphingomonadales bacterium 63-6]|nr:MAG: hypothetical protein BGO57_14735 [Sphingomonadales bacterium 63-6]